MENLNIVISGLKNYLDVELVAKITGLNKWIVGAGLSMALDNSAKIFNQIKQNPIIQSMEIISQDDEIDTDKIYKYLSDQSKKSAVTFDMPFVGAITLKSEDVDKIYRAIKEVKNERTF